MVTAVQPSRRQITIQTEEGIRPVGYDYLVYALGSSVSTDAVPGVADYAYTLDHASALALAERLRDVATQGGRLLIVGCGNTGVEVATELAEVYPGLRITVATRRSFGPQLSPAAGGHIRKAFNRLGIQFVENTAIVQLHEHGALTERGETIPFDVCAWVGGFAVPDLARRAGMRVNENGQILIDRAIDARALRPPRGVGDQSAAGRAVGLLLAGQEQDAKGCRPCAAPGSRRACPSGITRAGRTMR